MQSAMARGTPALPGGMQVQESPLHVRASTHAPAVNSSVTPPDLQAGALVAPEEGGHQPAAAQSTLPTEGATQGFQPTQPRKGQAATGDGAEDAAAGEAMVAAATAAV